MKFSKSFDVLNLLVWFGVTVFLTDKIEIFIIGFFITNVGYCFDSFIEDTNISVSKGFDCLNLGRPFINKT